jgi:hypothetical protein
VTLDIARPPSLDDPAGSVAPPCYACGHPRLGHRDADTGYWVCAATVSLLPDVETPAREGCPCEGYLPDDGRGRWALDGSREMAS